MSIQPFFFNDENENIECTYGANICILNFKLTRSVLSSQGIGFISPVMVNTFFTLFSENIKNNSDFLMFSFDVKSEHCSKMDGGKKGRENT